MTDRRVQPHDLEAERALLGISILEPKRIPDAIGLVTPEDFYGDKNKEVFKSIVTLATDNKEVNLASIYEQIGGRVSATEIGKLVDGLQAGGDIYVYGRIVKEKSGLRNIIKAAQEIAMSAYDGDTDEASKLISGLSMVKMMGRREHALAEDVKKWVSITNGNFSVTDCYNSLQNVTLRDRPNVRVVLHRLKSEGIIEPSGGRDGIFRRVERELEILDFLHAPTEGLTFDWPLDLNDVCTIFPKDIVCFAGAQNAGKTAIAVDFIRRNMNKWDIHYFNSEMSASRLRDRLSKVDDVALDAWKFTPYTRSDDFQDVIKPNAVNIIDYLEIVDNYWEVAKKLKDVHKKLDQGISIILLQKDDFRDTGRGGGMSLEKPVLYVALNHGRAKIVKAKSWKGASNPNKMIADFKLVHGWKFVMQNPWHSEEADEEANKSLGKQTKFQRTFKG
jgi:hypothetical protein